MKNEYKNTFPTDILKFFAIVLIINSHIDSLVPINFISTGGSIGNALFFALSGYGLIKSQNNNNLKFTDWIVKRLKRIYIPLTIYNILFYIPLTIYFQNTSNITYLEVFKIFFFPSNFIFIQAIILFYLISYPIVTNFSNKKIILAFLASITPFLYLYFSKLDLNTFNMFNYSNITFQILGWFLIFLVGVYCGSKPLANKNTITYLLISIVSLLLIYTQRYTIYKGNLLNLQIFQQLFHMTLVFGIIKVFESQKLLKIFQNTIIEKLISFISKITLEIYLVHVTLLSFFDFNFFKFPLNIFLLLTITLSLSYIVKRISNNIEKLRI